MNNPRKPLHSSEKIHWTSDAIGNEYYYTCDICHVEKCCLAVDIYGRGCVCSSCVRDLIYAKLRELGID